MHVFICIIKFSNVLMPSTFVHDPICVPLCTSLWSQSRDCVSLPEPVLLSICLSLLVWPFTFTKKWDCNKTNIVLFVVSIITILVKLLQMIWGYITGFGVCPSFCLSNLSVSLKYIYILHHNCVKLSMPHFSDMWSCSH